MSRTLASRRRSVAAASSGLTLVEVVIAMTILSIILLGAFSTMLSAQRFDLLTRQHQAASEAAFKEMDLVLGNPNYDAIKALNYYFTVKMKSGTAADTYLRPAVGAAPVDNPDTTVADDPATTNIDESAFGDESEYGVGHMVCTTSPNGLGADLCLIAVTLAWRASDGSDQSLFLSTMRVR